jgi:fluoride exporter
VKQILFIAIFGAVGALSRYGAGYAVRHFFGKSFPLDTLAVNVLGCLLIGFIMYGAFAAKMDEALKTGLVVGFLGAFTTFSAFGYATFDLLQKGAWPAALLNAALNLFVGLLAVWLGMTVGRAMP